MKKSTTILLLLAVSLTAMAQITHGRQGQQDQNAAAILGNAAATFDQNVSFNVAAVTYNAEKKQTASREAHVLDNRGKYRLTSGAQELICDGVTLWQWNKTSREVIVSTLGSDDIDPVNPGRLLSGYGQNFRAKYIRTEADGTAIVDLQPRSARSFHKIRLLVDTKNSLLKRIEVHRYDGGRETYDITGFKRASTPASQFTFDARQNAGVEIIDMR